MSAIVRCSAVAAAWQLRHQEALARVLIAQVGRARGPCAVLATLKISGQDLQNLSKCFLLGTLRKRDILVKHASVA